MRDYFSEEIFGQERDYFAEEILGEEEEELPPGGYAPFMTKPPLSKVMGGAEDFAYNIARDIPRFAAEMPMMLLPGPVREILGIAGKVTEPIRRKVEELPLLSPLKRLEEAAFAEGGLHEPEALPSPAIMGEESQLFQTILPMLRGEEGVSGVARRAVGATPLETGRAVGKGIFDPESGELQEIAERPLPHLMNAMILLGLGGGAAKMALGKGKVRPTEARAPVEAKPPIAEPEVFPGLREKVTPTEAPPPPIAEILGLERPKVKPKQVPGKEALVLKKKLKAKGVTEEGDYISRAERHLKSGKLYPRDKSLLRSALERVKKEGVNDEFRARVERTEQTIRKTSREAMERGQEIEQGIERNAEALVKQYGNDPARIRRAFEKVEKERARWSKTKGKTLEHGGLRGPSGGQYWYERRAAFERALEIAEQPAPVSPKGAKVPAAKPPSGREPWEMTREEYVTQGTSAEGFKQYQRDMRLETQGKSHTGFATKWNARHDVAVKDALSEGKLVPSEVLAEYPELGKGRVATRAFEAPPTRLEVEMEPRRGKPQDLPSIVRDLGNELGVPIRTGFFQTTKAFGRAKRLGIYKEKPEAIRIKTANDLATTSHEVAHHIDKMHELTKKLPEGVGKEIGDLAYEGAKDIVPEGFAEFVRHWLTDETAADVAPKTNAWFETFLKEQPELARTLKKAKIGISRWREQGAEARIEATLVKKPTRLAEGVRGALREGWLEFRRAIDDNLAPIKRFTKEVEKKIGRTLLEKEDPFAVATATRNMSGTKARQWFDVATADFDGKVTGPPLKAIFKGVKNKEMQAVEYAYAKHALERWSKGKNPGISKADAQWLVEKYKSPEFDTFAKELSAFSDKALDYVVDSGAFPKETAEIFRDMYENYMPLFREMESTIGGAGGPRGKGFADMPQAFRRAKGSGRRVIDPVTSIMLQTERLISWADRARIGKMIADLSQKTEGMGEWVERVAIPATAKKIKIGEIVEQLRKEGVDVKAPEELLTPEFMEQTLSFWAARNHGIPKENIVTFFDSKAKLHAYQLKPALYKAVKQMDGIQLPHALRIITAPIQFGKKAVTLGATGLRLSFGWGTNLLRDPYIYYLQSKNPKATPLKGLLGTAKIVQKKLGWNPTEAWRLFQQQGGEFGTFMNTELPRAMKKARTIMKDARHAKALNVIRHPGQLYREIVNMPESGPRFAEFEAIYKKRFKETRDHRSAWIAALNASKDVTVNFSRLGYMTQIVNRFVPFFGPAVAGLSKVGRSFKDAPVRTTLRGLSITAASLALWNRNKDEDWYKALPGWDKYGFWHFKLSDKEDAPIYRLPKPFEWGMIFASIPEAAANDMLANDPDAMREAFDATLERTLPPVMPALIGPIYDVSRGEGGYDPFRERAIVPQSEVQNLPPEMRYGRYTTETGKGVGKFLGVSPRKVDYLISGVTGGAGMDITRGAEAVTKPSTEPKELPDIPFLGRFVSRRPFVNDFYEFSRKVDSADRSVKKMSGEKQTEFRQKNKRLLRSIVDMDSGKTVTLASRLRGIGRQMSELRKEIKRIQESTLSAQRKREKVTILEKQIENLAKQGLRYK